MRSIKAAICGLTFVAALTTAQADPASGQIPAPFHRPWRAVLDGVDPTELAAVCGGTPRNATISASELDEIDKALLPLLATDLRRIFEEHYRLVRSGPRAPEQYYRQYASAFIGGKPVVVVNGFPYTHFDDIAANLSGHWRIHFVNPNDGGDAYWCAIYSTDSHSFVKIRIKEDGKRSPPWTVLFHGFV